MKNIGPYYRGSFIMTEDTDKKEQDEELKKKVEQEERELDNPDNLLLHSEPVWLIDEAPKACHIHLALEREVPVVVILTTDKFKDMQECFIWQKMNVPEINPVITETAGHPSNVGFIQDKWRKEVKKRHTQHQSQLKRKYDNWKPSPAKKSEDVKSKLPPTLQNIFKMLDSDGDNNKNIS